MRGHVQPGRLAELAQNAVPTSAEQRHLDACRSCRADKARIAQISGLFVDATSIDELSARRLEIKTLDRWSRARTDQGRRRKGVGGWAVVAAVLVSAPAGWIVHRARVTSTEANADEALATGWIQRFVPAKPLQCTPDDLGDGVREGFAFVDPEPEPFRWAEASGLVFAASRFDRTAADASNHAGQPTRRPAQPPPLSPPASTQTVSKKPRAAPAPTRARAPVRPNVADRSSTMGEVEVRIRKPASSFMTHLEMARRAFVVEGHPLRGAEHARKARERARTRHELFLAQDLECNALIAAQAYVDAVAACRRLLSNVEGERGRSVHFTLATLFRKLGDCRSAIPHYSASIMFGASTVVGHEARRFRAECALKLGDLRRAEQDVAYLELNPALVSRPEELRRLRKLIDQAVQGQGEVSPRDGAP
ncbi:MAG: hypothetical protein ACFB9M_04585 [Myxococcota bacterium]